MSSPCYFLFVYGSLRSGFKSQAYDYISRFFTLICDAKVQGKMFDMGEYPVAVPTTDATFITGELYQIREQKELSWAMGQLDDYEGVFVEEDEPQLYRRELTEVICGDKKCTAWIYWYNGDTTGRPVVSSGDILQYIREKN